MYIVQILTLLFVLTILAPPIRGKNRPTVPPDKVTTSNTDNVTDSEDDDEPTEGPDDTEEPDDDEPTTPTTTTTTAAAKLDIYDPSSYKEAEISKSCKSKGNFLRVVFNELGSCDAFLISPCWLLVSYDCLRNKLGIYKRKVVRTITSPIELRPVLRTRKCSKCSLMVIKTKTAAANKRITRSDFARLPEAGMSLPFTTTTYFYSVIKEEKSRRRSAKITTNFFCADVTIQKCVKPREKGPDKPKYVCATYKCKDTKHKNFVDLCNTDQWNGGGLIYDGTIYGFLKYDSCGDGQKRFSNLKNCVGWIRSKTGVRSSFRVQNTEDEDVEATSNGRMEAAGSMMVLVLTGLHVLGIFTE